MVLNTKNSCHFCRKVCKSSGGPKRQSQNKFKDNKMDVSHVCNFCVIGYKGFFGLKSLYMFKAKLGLTHNGNLWWLYSMW